jgi:hypothetical protein
MNRAEFQSKEANMAELAMILRTPVFNAALEVIKGESLGYLPDPIPGVDYGAQVAALGAQAIGWTRAIHALETLVINPRPLTGRPIEQQFDDAARRRMRAAGLYTDEEISTIEP